MMMMTIIKTFFGCFFGFQMKFWKLTISDRKVRVLVKEKKGKGKELYLSV